MQCKVTSMNGNGGGGGASMGQMGSAGNLNNAINMGPGVGVGVGGMMGMGMGMGGADQRRPLGDLGMVQDGTRCGDNMVSEATARGNTETET